MKTMPLWKVMISCWTSRWKLHCSEKAACSVNLNSWASQENTSPPWKCWALPCVHRPAVNFLRILKVSDQLISQDNLLFGTEVQQQCSARGYRAWPFGAVSITSSSKALNNTWHNLSPENGECQCPESLVPGCPLMSPLAPITVSEPIPS